MAIFHLSVKTISRSQGRSAVAASAYRAGVVLSDARYGLEHDYTRKKGVASSFIVAPDAATWAQDREVLWNRVEEAEKRKNSTVAREYELALPAELTDAEREALTRSFAQEIVTRYGIAADVAIHRAGREGDQRNHHAHILTTTRVVTAEGLTEKTRVLDAAKTGSAEIEALRALWADQINAALERNHKSRAEAVESSAPRVDHRSFARQGIALEPTVHMGVAASAMERRAYQGDTDAAPVTERGKQNAKAREKNRLLELARERMTLATEGLASLGRKAHAVMGFARLFGARRLEVQQQEEARETAEKEALRQAHLRGEIPTVKPREGLFSRMAVALRPQARRAAIPPPSSAWFDQVRKHAASTPTVDPKQKEEEERQLRWEKAKAAGQQPQRPIPSKGSSPSPGM